MIVRELHVIFFQLQKLKCISSIRSFLVQRTFHFHLISIRNSNGKQFFLRVFNIHSFINHLAFPFQFMAAYHYAKIEFGSRWKKNVFFFIFFLFELFAHKVTEKNAEGNSQFSFGFVAVAAAFNGKIKKKNEKRKTIYINLHVSTSKFKQFTSV